MVPEIQTHLVFCLQLIDLDIYFLACVWVFSRVISSMQRQMVMDSFTPEFTHKLQDFYKRFYFPAELKSLRNRCVCLSVSLCVKLCL